MTPIETVRVTDDLARGEVRRRQYRSLLLSQVPRILSAADRNPLSPTFGCLDRAYWHYRTMTDYAAPIHQEGALSLVLVSQQEDEDNPYFASEQLRDVAIAALRYWCRLQRSDGSFDEFYPGERSFVATAFTSYAVSETVRRLVGVAEDLDEVIAALRKACEWLSRHRDVVVVNHTAGAIAAIYNVYLLTGDERLLDYREAKIADLLEHQHEEGWFYEYGGADLAYLSLCIDYLAKDYRHSRDGRLGESISQALQFMACFLHPDGSFGGEYGSRNAKYLMPHGLEVMAGERSEAAYLLAGHHRALAAGTVVSPAVMDDRYGAFFANKYAEAWADCHYDKDGGHGLESEGIHHFPGAGLLVQRDSDLYTVVGLSKHGVLKTYSRGQAGRLLFSDAGYFARFEGDVIGTTQWLDPEAEARVDVATDADEAAAEPGTEISLSCQMRRTDTSLPMREHLISFRLFLMLAAWSGTLMDLFGKKIKQRMIGVRQTLPLRIDRTIAIKPRLLLITDRIQVGRGARLQQLTRCRDAAALHVASSRYYQLSELDVAGDWQLSLDDVEALNNGHTVELETRVTQGMVPDQAVVRVESRKI